MTQACSYQLSANVGVNPTATGAEVGGTRRLLYLADAQYARISYAGGGLGDCAVGVAYSLDSGITWAALVDYGPTLGAAGTVLASGWTDLGDLPVMGDVLVCALARGAALSLGLLYQLQFIELQVR